MSTLPFWINAALRAVSGPGFQVRPDTEIIKKEDQVNQFGSLIKIQRDKVQRKNNHHNKNKSWGISRKMRRISEITGGR